MLEENVNLNERLYICLRLKDECRYIFDILNSVNQDKASVVNILGIDLSTLYRKLKRYDAV